MRLLLKEQNIGRSFWGRGALCDRRRRKFSPPVRAGVCVSVARGVSEFYPTVRENVSDFDSFVPRRRALSLRLSMYVRVCVFVCRPCRL